MSNLQHVKSRCYNRSDNFDCNVEKTSMSTSSHDIIVRNERRPPDLNDSIEYFDSIATYTDELRKLQKELRQKIRNYVNEDLR